jgi:beta-lactam-binding protein with PASTA domain
MFGADDIDGTIGDTTKIYSMAGGVARPTMSVEELESMVVSAGFVPVERDSHYNSVSRDNRGEQLRHSKIVKQEVKVETPKPVAKIEKVENKEIDMQNKKTAESPKRSSSVPRKSSKAGDAGYIERAKMFYRRKPIISHIILIGIFCLLLLMGLYVGLKRGTRLGSTIAVPNFLGMNIEEAYALADENDLNIVVRDSIFDVDLPGGTIVDQLPRLSTVRDVTVKPGRKIYVTTNAYNRRMVDIPYVAKQTLRQALNQIERSGLTISKLSYEPDMTSTDYVLAQYVGRKEILPTTNGKYPVGTGVTLKVSYRRDESSVYVPRMVGLSLQQAKHVLWDSGLNVGKIVYDESVGDIISQRKARVYRQSKGLGTTLKRGSEVTLYLSCDEALVDSMNVVASKELKSIEAQRRRAAEASKNSDSE